MEHITKSLTPVALLAAAAVVFVLGTAFLLASDATLSSSLGASSDLAQAGRWIQFLAGGAAMAAWLSGSPEAGSPASAPPGRSAAAPAR